MQSVHASTSLWDRLTECAIKNGLNVEASRRCSSSHGSGSAVSLGRIRCQVRAGGRANEQSGRSRAGFRNSITPRLLSRSRTRAQEDFGFEASGRGPGHDFWHQVLQDERRRRSSHRAHVFSSVSEQAVWSASGDEPSIAEEPSFQPSVRQGGSHARHVTVRVPTVCLSRNPRLNSCFTRSLPAPLPCFPFVNKPFRITPLDHIAF
jgi:hypothetical protein